MDRVGGFYLLKNGCTKGTGAKINMSDESLIKRSLSSNTLLLSIGVILNKGIQFIMIPLFSRWLSTEDYGNFDLYSTYVTLLIPIITLACSDAVFRFGIEENDIANKSKYISSGFTIMITNFFITCNVVMIIYVKSKWIFAVPFILLVFAETLNNFLQGYMRSIRKLNIYAACSTLSSVLVFLFVYIFVYRNGLGLYGMILGYSLGYLGNDIFIILTTKFTRYIRLNKISFKTVKKILSYSYALIPNNVSWWIINVSDRWVIKYFLNSTSNGIYALSAKIPNFCTSIFSVFSISWQEAAIDSIDLEKRNEYFTRVYNRLLDVLLSVCAVVLSCNYIFFGIIFDMRYSAGQKYAPILVTSALFGAIAQFYGGIQISQKRPKANGLTTMIAAFVNISSHILLVNLIGLYAASISTLLSNLVLVALRFALIHNDIHILLTKKTKVNIIIYTYFFIVSLLQESILFNIFNMALAILAFLCINKPLISEILIKFIHFVKNSYVNNR